jgi:hypothetical protein
MLLPEIPGAVPDSGFACHRTTQCREADLHDHPSASRCQAVRPAGASLSRRERSLPSAAVSQGCLSVSPIRARLARPPYDGRSEQVLQIFSGIVNPTPSCPPRAVSLCAGSRRRR